MRHLRVEDPWKAEQTHDSLKRYLLEEAYEVFEAIDAYDPDTGEGADELCGELGDLLYQVVFHSSIGAEAGWFTLADVARSIHDKLERPPRPPAGRPPSGGPGQAGVAGAVTAWESAKQAEQGRESAFDGIPAALPALARALKVARKAEALGLAVAGLAPRPAGAAEVARAAAPWTRPGVRGLVGVDSPGRRRPGRRRWTWPRSRPAWTRRMPCDGPPRRRTAALPVAEGGAATPPRVPAMPEPLQIAPATGRLGILTPGMGAVASTAYAGVLATRQGLAEPIGSLTQMAHIRLGRRDEGRNPMIKDFVPLAGLDDLVFGGWDPISPNALEAARTCGVLDERDLAPLSGELEGINAMPAVFDQRWVKKLDGVRVKTGESKWDLAQQVIADIEKFRTDNECDRLVMVWCGSDRGLPGAHRGAPDAWTPSRPGSGPTTRTSRRARSTCTPR